jgi:hypothetical protein
MLKYCVFYSIIVIEQINRKTMIVTVVAVACMMGNIKYQNHE